MANNKNIFTLSRQKRNFIISAVIIFILSLSLIDRLYFTPAVIPVTKQTSPSADYAAFHNKTFTVIYIADGDTFDIDQPDPARKNTRIRLLGVDTPETKKPGSPIMHYGPQAAQFTKQKLLNKKVKILLDPISPTRDKYGRLLCYTQLPDGTNFNQLLIETGHAYADLRFQHTHFIKFRTLMQKAKKNNIGLWKNVKFQQLPDWLQRFHPNWKTNLNPTSQVQQNHPQ